MKTMILAALALCAAPSFAQEGPVGVSVRAAGRVLSDRTEMVGVELNDKTVKCSAADYQMPMLKVLVPGLADLTILNHRNTREGAPCIAAGRCSETLNPQGILAGAPASEAVPVRIVLSKEAQVQGNVCKVTLVETVSTTIRGVPFFHERRQPVADRSAADCR